jgi:hypothetical protein
MSSPKPDRDRKTLAILVVALIVILAPLGYYMGTQINATVSTNGCQCFTINYSQLAPRDSGTGVMNGTLANETAAHGPIPSYAQVFDQNRTIVFHSDKIDLVVFSYPNYMESTILNKPIPQYDCFAPCPDPSKPLEDLNSPSNSFAIYGLFQPTLVMPRGSLINVTFINMDPTDHHSFVFTSFAPPYAEYIMQNMAAGGEMVQMTPLIPPVNSTSNAAAVYQYTIHMDYNITRLWYTCMFPMHSNQGMWGNVTLV